MTLVVSVEMLVVVMRDFGGDDTVVEVAETVVLVMIVVVLGWRGHGFQWW